MDKTMSDTAEKLAEHLYGHSREKAIEWAKEDKFDSCYRNAEDIIELLLADGWRQCAKGQRTSQFCGQLEAEKEKSYATGATDGWAACESCHGIDPVSGVKAENQKPVGYVRAYALEMLSKPGHTVIDAEPKSDDDVPLYASAIRAIPITPTNTEGEHGE